MDAPWKTDPNGWVTVLRKACRRTENEPNVFLPADRLVDTVAMPYHLDYLIINDFDCRACRRPVSMAERPM